MPDQSNQAVVLANIRKWRQDQERRAIKRATPPELPRFRKLVEYEENGVKGWMTVPGGASVDGK